jgi:hypothetical protein
MSRTEFSFLPRGFLRILVAFWFILQHKFGSEIKKSGRDIPGSFISQVRCILVYRERWSIDCATMDQRDLPSKSAVWQEVQTSANGHLMPATCQSPLSRTSPASRLASNCGRAEAHHVFQSMVDFDGHFSSSFHHHSRTPNLRLRGELVGKSTNPFISKP